jgi:hypothetical protein
MKEAVGLVGQQVVLEHVLQEIRHGILLLKPYQQSLLYLVPH